MPLPNPFDLLHITESAAVAASAFIGKGDGKAADAAAVAAMRPAFDQASFCSTIVIGEGEKDEAPMLYTGETFCRHEREGGKPCPMEERYDAAVDPLECTDSVANGRPNAITVLAVGPHGSLFKAPDVYMDKVAIGPSVAADIAPLMHSYLSKKTSAAELLTNLALALNKPIEQLTVITLDRERHGDLIRQIRAAGARVHLISDGDVAGAISPSLPGSGIDCLLGIGASTETVLAAGALKALGGEIMARFAPKDDKQLQRIHDFGFTDLNTVYSSTDLASSNDTYFAATGVIDGPLLKGVEKTGGKTILHSVLMSTSDRTVRHITTETST